jgi:hypothetical protein
MGIFSAIGGLLGGGAAKKASKKAMRAQVEAANKGIAEVNKGWDYTQGLFQPWQQAGTGALGGVTNLLGLGDAGSQQAAIDALKASPFYQSLYRTGEEALLQNASATGGLRGGDTQRSLADFGADTLAQTIQQQLQNLGGVAQLGYGATEALGAHGSQRTSDISNLLLGQGQARASDYIRRGAITAGMWNNLGALGDQALGAVTAGFGAPGGGFNLGAAFGGGQPLFGGN